MTIGAGTARALPAGDTVAPVRPARAAEGLRARAAEGPRARAAHGAMSSEKRRMGPSVSGRAVAVAPSPGGGGAGPAGAGADPKTGGP